MKSSLRYALVVPVDLSPFTARRRFARPRAQVLEPTQVIRDLIAAILVAILIDVSWNAAGMRDPLPEPSTSTTTTFATRIMPGPLGAVLREGPASAVSDTADAIRRGSKADTVVTTSTVTGSTIMNLPGGGAVAHSPIGTLTWYVPGSDPSKLHCFTVDSAGNVINAGGVCP